MTDKAREAVARVVDPLAFEPDKVPAWEEVRSNYLTKAYAKADLILAAIEASGEYIRVDKLLSEEAEDVFLGVVGSSELPPTEAHNV